MLQMIGRAGRPQYDNTGVAGRSYNSPTVPIFLHSSSSSNVKLTIFSFFASFFFSIVPFSVVMTEKEKVPYWDQLALGQEAIER